MRECWRTGCLAIFLFGAALSPQKTEQVRRGPYAGPKSLGWYTHEHDVSLKRLLAAFGVQPSGKDIYCFADKEHGLYIHARVAEHDRAQVEDLFLSSFPNCLHMPVVSAEIPPEVWKTPEGIQIGSTRADVLRAYHQPTFRQFGPFKASWDEIPGIRDTDRHSADLGDEQFGYSCDLGEQQVCDDLQFFRVGFSKGQVVWLEISDSE